MNECIVAQFFDSLCTYINCSATVTTVNLFGSPCMIRIQRYITGTKLAALKSDVRILQRSRSIVFDYVPAGSRPGLQDDRSTVFQRSDCGAL